MEKFITTAIDLRDFHLEIETIKVAIINSSYRTNESLPTLFKKVIQRLKKINQLTHSIQYLFDALIYIEAYLELGFEYCTLKDDIDFILNSLNLSPNIFLVSTTNNLTLKLNRNAIRSVIGRWPKTPNRTLPINALIDDIIQKVQRKQIGVYHYESVQKKTGHIYGMYNLIIKNDVCYFHDVVNNKYYIFE